MIDKSDEVFNRVMDYVISEFPLLTADNFGSDVVDAPQTFPFISIVQTDARTNAGTQDDRLRENAAVLLFTIEIYSNKVGGKREECRKLREAVDTYMLRMNFSRETSGFLNNLSNNSIARLVSTYSVLADENNFYRR